MGGGGGPRAGGFKRFAGEGAGGDRGEHAREGGATGDQPAVAAREPPHGDVAGTGGVGVAGHLCTKGVGGGSSISVGAKTKLLLKAV